MKRVNQYTDDFKRRLVKEAVLGEESLEYYRRKYQIGGSMTLSRWIDKFATETGLSMPNKESKNKEHQESEALRAELALLKRELEEERLRRQAYQLMIKIAEEEFQIPIEKKSGVKQHKK